MTTSWTEADLEAAIHEVLKITFPWLPAHAIRHQTKFSFTFGRKKIEIDGSKASQAEARADILLCHDEKPLAVLELKRSGISLTPYDDAQGLSYARVVNPQAPLVIVTNGHELHCLETHSGNQWHPSHYNERSFLALVANAANIAASDTKLAVDTLMGTNANVWQQAVRNTSKETLSDLNVSLDAPANPFVRGFLIPRKSADLVMKQVTKGANLILVEGPPLIGKSNVLREITLNTMHHSHHAMLYIEGGVGQGILQSLADTLSRSLNWPVSPVEARNWLVQVSRNDAGHKLLLAIDGLDIDNQDARREIEDLTSNAFSEGLVIVVALDDTVAEQLVHLPSGRSTSAIGRRARRIKVGPLDNEEFVIAKTLLSQRRIRMMHGAYASLEFRQPWILGAISKPAIESIEQANLHHFIMLPPLLSLNLIRLARERFIDEKVRRLFKAIGTALLIDTRDQQRHYSLKIESSGVNLVRRKILVDHVDASELQWLLDHGYLRPAMHQASNESILYIRLPELLASEVARLLADELIPLAQRNPRDASAFIAGAASNLPIGDVIAAQAILDAATQPTSLPFELIRVMLETIPKREPVPPGTRSTMYYPGKGLVELVLHEDGSASIDFERKSVVVDLEGDLPYSYHNIHEWLVLSHLAAIPLMMEIDGNQKRIDPRILLKVGTANEILRRPEGELGMNSILTHEISGIGTIICHKDGIVEPITYSVFLYLAREGDKANRWIDKAIAQESMPLLSRIDIALREISSSASQTLSTWATSTLEKKVTPSFKIPSNLHGN